MDILRFRPLLKHTIWGGERIARLKRLDSAADDIGESWEVSALPGEESIVDGGPYDGKTISYVVRRERERLLGRDNYRRFGDEFPLLVKFIDARDDLSIQVHPDDATARRHGERRGKTEMWYVMPSAPGAQLYSGLRQWITPRQYENMVASRTITDAIALHDVSEGDVFYIPAGRIHSIRRGCLIAEIQQTCDLTYRIYDYNRRDKNGNLRELHTKKAAESIDYTVQRDYRTHYIRQPNRAVRLVTSPYFVTSLYDLDRPKTIDYSWLDSFVILMCVGGEGLLSLPTAGGPQPFRAGDTVVLPATTRRIEVTGKLKFLETYV